MRKFTMLSTLAALLVAAPVFAERVTIDLKDYDDDLMHDIERAIKYFEPDISGQNADAARDDAAELRRGFTYTHDYFSKKGNTQDAVEISKQGLQWLDTVLKELDAENYEAAAEGAREVSKACRNCHDTYKPDKARF
ncbi:hypothetical protein [uncultured Rhodoblastus sp.]|uniref:hypothetical protein n=1 Tax=uncultured Rhodoblastus sp. TaxID=543037 RepID=UPI0025D31D87|nr:hypothetical protein [uncultured Rhodoblastus sp.]